MESLWGVGVRHSEGRGCSRAVVQDGGSLELGDPEEFSGTGVSEWISELSFNTCKVAVSAPTAPKTANQFAIGLEGEDAAGLVVDHNDMSIPVHSHPLGAHEAASSNLGLRDGDSH